jgi:hypothetical protein
MFISSILLFLISILYLTTPIKEEEILIEDAIIFPL